MKKLLYISFVVGPVEGRDGELYVSAVLSRRVFPSSRHRLAGYYSSADTKRSLSTRQSRKRLSGCFPKLSFACNASSEFSGQYKCNSRDRNNRWTHGMASGSLGQPSAGEIHNPSLSGRRLLESCGKASQAVTSRCKGRAVEQLYAIAVRPQPMKWGASSLQERVRELVALVCHNLAGIVSAYVPAKGSYACEQTLKRAAKCLIPINRREWPRVDASSQLQHSVQ